MKKGVVICLLLVMLILTGCQKQNRYSMHGSQILQYQGDKGVLNNCCSAAMSILANDIMQNKGLDSNPPFNEKTTGWSTKKDNRLLC